MISNKQLFRESTLKLFLINWLRKNWHQSKRKFEQENGGQLLILISFTERFHIICESSYFMIHNLWVISKYDTKYENVKGDIQRLSENSSNNFERVWRTRQTILQCKYSRVPKIGMSMLDTFYKSGIFVDFIRFFHLKFDMSKIETPKIDTFLEFWAQVKCVNFWHRTVGYSL